MKKQYKYTIEDMINSVDNPHDYFTIMKYLFDNKIIKKEDIDWNVRYLIADNNFTFLVSYPRYSDPKELLKKFYIGNYGCCIASNINGLTTRLPIKPGLERNYDYQAVGIFSSKLDKKYYIFYEKDNTHKYFTLHDSESTEPKEGIKKVSYADISFLPKAMKVYFCISRLVDYDKDYNLLKKEVLDGNLTFYSVFGKDRGKIKDSKDLLELIKSDNFNSASGAPMSSTDVQADQNLTAVLLYHYKLINKEITLEILDLFSSGRFNGRKTLPYFTKKIKAAIANGELDLSDDVKLLFEIL